MTDAWEAVASEWERRRQRTFEGFRHVSEWLIARIDPQPGQTILELAAGPGETGFLAAARIGEGGRLISTDLAPTMVEAARRGAAARGLANVECRTMDAQAIDLPDDSVDAVVCRLGLMLVPDPEAALAEIRRVLRPGGTLSYAVMGPPDRNQWMSLVMGALAGQGRMPMGGNPFALGGVFGLSSPAVNEQLLAEAGFTDVTVDEMAGTMPFASAEDLWELQSSLAEPVRQAAESMSSEDVDAVIAALREMIQPYGTTDGYDLPTLLVVAAAR